MLRLTLASLLFASLSLGGCGSDGSDDPGESSAAGGGGSSGPDDPGSSSGGGSAQPGGAECGDTPATTGPGPGGDSEDERLLRMAVRFYGAQRSGDTGNWLLTGHPRGAKCFENDGATEGLDLAGGWHDAGDHIKFTLTIAYAAYALLKAYDAFPAAFSDRYDARYCAANGVPDVLDEVRVATDYLLKIRTAKGIVSRVGQDEDHQRFVMCPTQATLGPELGGDPRTVYFAENPDLSGLAAAALAAGARAFRPFDATLADSYLEEAKALFEHTRQHESEGPSNVSFYNNGTKYDDILGGAAELWAETQDDSYLDDVLRIADQALARFALSWDHTENLAHHTLAKRGQTLPIWGQNGEAPTLQVVCDDYLGKATGGAHRVADFGQSWGVLRFTMGGAFAVALCAEAFGGEQYRQFVLDQVDYVTGKNTGASFVVGVGESYPLHPHHRNAQGSNDPNVSMAVLGATPQAFLLEGALIGGSLDPTQLAAVDVLDRYETSEVAIDYNAGLVGAAAYAVTAR